MKKLINLTVVLVAIVLLFQLTSVQAGSFSDIGQIDDDPNIPAQSNESIIFFDSNDVTDANDANDPNLPDAAE